MITPERNTLIVRQLSASDLGWFAALQEKGIPAKQRAINFNAAIVTAILPAEAVERGEVALRARCLRPEAPHEQDRPLRKVGKNWRLGGPKVPGNVFAQAQAGDFLVCKLTTSRDPPYDFSWNLVTEALEPARHAALAANLGPHLSDRMAFFSDCRRRSENGVILAV
jgi:hypothetical protein